MTMTTNRIATIRYCCNCSTIDDDEAYILNNNNQHKQKERPRLSLRQYGGALTSITETPQLKRSAIFDPTSHRLSSSLTLPSSIQSHQHQNNNTIPSGSRRRHTVQSVGTNNDATSTIQWYDSDGSALLVDFPHKHDDGDQSVEDGYANQPCSNTHNLSDTTNNTNINNNNSNNTYDKHGRCIHHPQIQLRRRQLFSFSTEWKTIFKVCPDCCMEELNKLYASSSSSKKMNGMKESELEEGGKDSELDETELYDDDSIDDDEIEGRR